MAIMHHNIWDLIPTPVSSSIVGCKWMFWVKWHSDGNIDVYKTRIIEKSFYNVHGLLSTNIYHVIEPAMIKIVLSITVMLERQIRQMDINNTFLHNNLEEDVYMRSPLNFMDPMNPEYVCKFRKFFMALSKISVHGIMLLNLHYWILDFQTPNRFFTFLVMYASLLSLTVWVMWMIWYWHYTKFLRV